MKLLQNILVIFIAFTQVSSQTLKDVNLYFYGSSTSDRTLITFDNADSAFPSLPTTKFDPSKKTEIFIHGRTYNKENPSADAIIGAYLANKASLNINVALIDWVAHSNSWDPLFVVIKLNRIADTAKDVLNKCKARGLDITKTHLVGFNHGATIAGRIGRWFKDNQFVSFPRITGLDPANYFGSFNLVYFANGVKRLTRDDASFVDIIHTDSKGIGDSLINGHVDFYPNGGQAQPKCFNFFTFNFVENFYCSHNRAWEYYKESIGKPSAFLSKQCSTATYSDSKCTGTTTNMGYYASSSVAGFNPTGRLNFWCATNGESPFSKS